MKTIKFKDDPIPYEIKALSDRYAVCTRPIDRKVDRKLIKDLTKEEIKTVQIYTLIDFEENVRSTNNRVFNPYDYSKEEDCIQCLNDLISGEVELSRRNQVELEIGD